jgi:hypothetical protein
MARLKLWKEGSCRVGRCTNMRYKQHSRLQNLQRFYSAFKLSTWGICFSFEANPSHLNGRGFVTVLPRFYFRSPLAGRSHGQ